MRWQQAAENGDVDALSDIHGLVDQETRARPLHYAAKGGQYNAVQYMIGRKVFIDETDKFGRTALYMAVFYRYSDIVDLLLKEKASADIICQCGTSMVSKAAENGDTEILDLLLERGASWNTKNIDGETPKYLALRNGHHVTWGRFHLQEIERLRSFHDASKKELITAMKDLVIRGGVNPNARSAGGSSALDLAAQNGRMEAVRFLLYDTTISLVPTAQRAGEVDGRNRTPLHWAARKGDLAIVELLLEAGANPSARDKSGKTPLDYAAQRDREKVSEVLGRWIERGH